MAHASWLDRIFDPALLEETAQALASKIGGNFDAIAIRGMSGLIIGGVVSVMTKLPLIAVRKRESTHSAYEDVEYSSELSEEEFDYCIIDDLVATGKTIRTIADVVCRSVSDKAHLRTIFLYDDNSYHDLYTIVNGERIPLVGLYD